jgi:predicted permease
LPLFFTAGAGYLLGKTTSIEPRSLSRIVFYIFSPCLIFILLTTNELESEEIIKIMAFAITVTISIGLLSLVVSRIFKIERKLTIAIILTSMFTNAGNFGLSLISFAFGQQALAHASLYFVTSASLIYTLGVVIASMGNTSLGTAVKGLFKIPTMYGLVAGFLFNKLDISLPLYIDRSVTLLSNAAIPCMLVLLGLQLERSKWTKLSRPLILANAIRLIISPLVAFGFSGLFGLSGATRQAGILEASMPSAVMTTVLATEYDIEPSFVTMIVTTTTLLSPLSLTPLLFLLGG